MNGDTNFKLPAGKHLDLLALLACFSLALAFRLPGLTVFLTADEPRSWFGRSIIFLDALARGDWANTAPGSSVGFIENVSLSPAPGVTTMWTGALGLILEFWRQGAPGSLAQFVRHIPFDPLDPAMLTAIRLPGVLIAAAAVGLTYWWSRPLLGRRGALLVTVFFALDPFYLALSRVLGHDALVTTFMWLSLLSFLRAILPGQITNYPSKNSQQPPSAAGLNLPPSQSHSTGSPHPKSKTQNPKSPAFSLFLLLSGACAGLAFLSKYPALFIGAFIALAMLVVYILQARSASQGFSNLDIHRILLHWVRDMALWSAAAGLVFVLLWPAMWTEPLEPLAAIVNDALRASGSSHQKGSYFLGRPVADPGAFFYPIVTLLRLTPVVFVGLMFSVWFLIRGAIGHRAHRQAQPDHTPHPRLTSAGLILLAYVLLYTLLVTYGGKKQDRYILPVFPALAMLAALGYLYLPRLGLRAAWRRWLLPAALVLFQSLLVVPYYPYYFTYYNSFAGLVWATDTIQVGWGEGLNEAAAYLNNLPNADSTKVVAWYSTTFEPYFTGESIYELDDEKISRSAKPGLAADYVVLYVNQVQREIPSSGALQYFQAVSPVYTVTLQGIDYAWVYPSLGLRHVIRTEARLVGQAELLGYELVDEAGRPITAVYPESVAFFSLYWEWQGKAEAEPIQISLVDAGGQTRGWGNAIDTVAPLPYPEWQEGMIVRDDFALVIFADTVPGEYRLSAWIDRPATGETVGVFPLGNELMIRVVPGEAG
jgi:4-amino-4-deoxy-L-arabinose transferase-like glycosyltransferase